MTVQRIPPSIRLARHYVEAARQCIPAPCFEYIAGGSGEGITAAANERAFERLSVWPRIAGDLGEGHTRIELPGARLASPVGLAPVAWQTLVHPEGECETARGAAVGGSLLVASTLASRSLEDIAVAATDTPRWFQLYRQPDPAVTRDLMRRAAAAGYGAIVVTLDAAIQVPNQKALDLGFRLPAGLRAGSLDEYPDVADAPPDRGPARLLRAAARHVPTWQQLEQLRAACPLPLWVKGVMHAADALELRRRGFDGAIVSNHGGRGLDGAPASLAALPAIRAAVGPGWPLLLDGGVRSGLDVFKALALGADAVLVGRSQVYALAVAGALGVAHLLRCLDEELQVCMALAGCATLADIRSARVE